MLGNIRGSLFSQTVLPSTSKIKYVHVTILCLDCYPWKYICDWVWENRSYRHNNWYPFFACTWKLHSCTTQKHQVLDHRWPGLLLQTAFYRCCQTTRVHFMALEGINRTAWGTRLLLTAVLASLVDSTSLCPILRAQHCCLSPNSCFGPPLASHPPLSPPPSCPPTPYRLNPRYYRHRKKLSKKPAACK